MPARLSNALRIAFILALGSPRSVAAAQGVTGEPPPALDDQRATVAQVLEQAVLAAHWASPIVAPRMLFDIARAAEECSFESSLDIATRAFDAAVALPYEAKAKAHPGSAREVIGSIKRETTLGVIDWVIASSRARKQRDLLDLALAMAERIDYSNHLMARQEVYAHLVRILLARHEEPAIRQISYQVERADGAFPFLLAHDVIRSGMSSELAAEFLRYAYLALRSGRCGKASDLEFVVGTLYMVPRPQVVDALQGLVRNRADAADPDSQLIVQRARAILRTLTPGDSGERRSGPAEPARSREESQEAVDPFAQAYEELQVAAEESGSAVSQRASAIEDAQVRLSILTSVLGALRREGKDEAAARVEGFLGSIPPLNRPSPHPAEDLMRARATLSGEALYQAVRQSLSGADVLLAEDNKNYVDAGNDDQRLRAYLSASQESIAVYRLAAEFEFGLAAESALRVIGPQRADVLAAVLAKVCKDRSGDKN